VHIPKRTTGQRELPNITGKAMADVMDVVEIRCLGRMREAGNYPAIRWKIMIIVEVGKMIRSLAFVDVCPGTVRLAT